jgi:glycosyltransferase involved in cell wall biosynthesis
MHTIVYDHQTFVTQEFGGISRYFCELASRIHGRDGFKARVIAPLHHNAYLPSCEVPKTAYRLQGNFRGRGRLCQTISGALTPALIRLSHPSLVHRTYYTPYPRPGELPVVLSVFDMIHELFPKSFGTHDPTFRNKYPSIKAADHLICISESTADDLMRLFDVPRAKISVTYLACSDVFAAAAPTGEVPPHSRPYLLYVGQRAGYKNFDTALLAYASSPQLRDEFDFAVFGGHTLSRDEQELIDSLKLRPGTIVRLNGSDQELARAYRHARAFVYPSKYEGFGIPPLEAMSSGCVVVSSNASSIPEVVGDAAAVFDPTSIDDARRALEEACFSESTRARLLSAGADRVRQFTWDRCARETSAAYRRVING